MEQDFQEWIELILSSINNPTKFIKLKPELSDQIVSIQKTDELTENFKNDTDKFIDNYSPKIITEILNLTPSDQDYTRNLNQILELYINLIPKFLLTDHQKFTKSAQRILIEKDFPFYFSTTSSSISYLSTSPYYSSNLKLFINSDILNRCKTYFESILSNNSNQSASSSFDIYYNVIFLINSFHNQWDKKAFKTFFNSFSSSFIQGINDIEQQDFRNTSENQINSIFNILFEMNEQDQNIIQNLKNAQIDFCLRMLNSDYLRKQFCAIHTLQSMNDIPDKVFEKIKEDHTLDKIFHNLHDELFTGYAWLLKKMILKGYIDSSYLLNLWDITLSKYTFYIEKWSNIINNLTPEIEEIFWQKIAKTRSFPIQVYSLLRKISNKANDSQKNMIFQCLFTQVFSSEITKETENEVIQTIIYYIPKDPSFRSTVQDQCIDLIKNDIHIRFSLSLLKKLVFYYDAKESRDLFHRVIEIKPNITNCTQDYLEFFVSDMRHFVTPLSDEESDKFSSLIRKLVPEKSKELQKFFEDIAKTQKIIFQTFFFQNAIIRLCEVSSKPESNILDNESYIDLIICLFKELNRKSFESMTLFNDLWIQSVNNLICEDEIWKILYKTSSLKLASFLSKLYTNCKEPRSLQVFIEHCLNQPANYGALTALLESIEQREGIIIKKNKINKWKKADEMMNNFYSNTNIRQKTVEVKITGDFSETLSLPISINSQALKSRISDLLLLRKESFNLQLNGRSLPSDSINFSKASLLKISINEKERIIPVKPTDFLEQEENNFLVSLLSSEDNKISEVALKIVNNLPTNETEMNLLTGEKPIDWNSVFDTTHINLLLYRLNAIGNLLETEWKNRFNDEGGALCLYQILVANNHLYRTNHLILLLLEYLIESNNPIFSSFDQNDFNVLIKLIFEEDEELANESNAVILFNILKSESFSQSNALFSLPIFNELVSKSIFHHNIHYRTTISSIISLKPDLKEYLLQFLDSSDCDFCQEFYQLFESSLNNQIEDPKLFKQLSDLIESHFTDTKDVQKLLFMKSPSEPFVNGIISLLYKLLSESLSNSTSESDNQNLITFLIQYVAFNPIFYYPLKKYFFSLLKLLMNMNQSNNQLLFSKLSEIHEKAVIPSLISNVQFTALHEERKGLKNLGSTCYANSVLQQLFNVIDFRNSFLRIECEENDWMFELQMIFAKLLFFPSSFVNTKPFFNIWKGWDGKPLKTFEQQDAVEFLQLVIDRINEKFPNCAEIFRGKVQHETVGVNVEYKKTNDEDFTTLGLEVCDQKDINDSLSTFLLPDFHNDYNADDLGRINVQRFHRILKAPTILIIQLKRFTYDLQHQQRIKITKKFTFPHILDITRAMVDQSKKVEYELIGVVVHIGNAMTGHYFSYCKDLSKEADNIHNNKKYGKWFCCNDTRVRLFDGSFLPDIASGEASGGNLREDTAYILFYKKKYIEENQTNNSKIADNVITTVANEIQESLYTSVLTNISYAKFIYEICDENDVSRGPFIFNYIVKFIRIANNEQLIKDFIAKCNKYIEISPEFSNYVVSQNESHILMLLQNDYIKTREKYSILLCQAMEFADSKEVQKLIDFFISKLQYSVEFWSNFDDFFLPFLKCISINNCSNSSLLPALFDFLQTQVPEYVKEHPIENVYQRIKLNNVFKLLVVLLSSSALKNEYKSIVFSNSFLNKWIQSQYHAVSFAQLLRSFVIECPELSTVYFKFLVENANDLSPESAAGHFSVLSNSQNKSSDDQINWCFNFLRTKPPIYIKIFLEHLMIKMKESKIDFSFPFLKYGDIWINEWLFSSDLDLRKCIRKFIATVFKGQSNDDNSHNRLQELLYLLTSKLQEMAQITSKRRKENWALTEQLSVEYSLPTNTFYSLLSWVVVNGKFENELTEFANQLVDVLISHKALQLRDNFPQQRLVEVICLCNNKRFFEITQPKKFLTAFSNVDCTIEANKTMVFNAIKFIPNDHFVDVAKSEAFLRLTSFELSDDSNHNYHHHYYRTSNSNDEAGMKLSNSNENNSSSMGFSVFNSTVFPISMPTSLSLSLTNFENDKFMEYIFSQINPSTAHDIATALWRRNFHKVLIDNYFALISKQILKTSPETITVFIKQRCHFSIIEQIKSQLNIFLTNNNNNCKEQSDKDKASSSSKSSYYLTIYFQLLQAFNDSYRTAFFGKTTWYGSDKYYPIIRFWDKFKLLLIDIIKLITKSNDLNEIDSATALLRSISLIDDSFAIFIFEQLFFFKGKMLATLENDFRKSVLLLFDVVSNALINNDQKRPRVLNLLTSEFSSLIESNIYDKAVLNSLNRRINIFIEYDNKLKKTDSFMKNYKIWEDTKK